MVLKKEKQEKLKILEEGINSILQYNIVLMQKTEDLITMETRFQQNQRYLEEIISEKKNVRNRHEQKAWQRRDLDGLSKYFGLDDVEGLIDPIELEIQQEEMYLQNEIDNLIVNNIDLLTKIEKRKKLLAIIVHGMKEMPADVTILITKHITNKPKNITEIQREIKKHIID